VSVVERDLAINDPTKYASTVATAISEGKISVTDSSKPIPLDINNLKMADSSGRDLASRIFQTAALHAAFYPNKNYRNTANGVGEITAGDHDPRGTKPIPFDGLTPGEIADTRYKLTGDEKAVTFIGTKDDLQQAIKLNDGPPVTVMVDASGPPFNGPASDHKPNHIVTITGTVPGPPLKYLVQNQWGLASDHSTEFQAISAEDLFKNMNQYQSTADAAVSRAHGGVLIISGNHLKAFVIDKGHYYENSTATQNMDQDNRIRHPELFQPKRA